MQRFFAKWREFADRFARATVAACGVICVLGGWALISSDGPAWIGAVFATFGVLLTIASLVLR